MKRTFRRTMEIGIILFSCLTLQAQIISRWVFGTGGNHYISSDISISCTVGQSGLVGTLTAEHLTITAGFQQMDDQLSTSFYDEQNHISITVYPNPFTDHFVLALETNLSAKLNYVLYDMNGRIIFDKHNTDLNVVVHQEIINTPYLASGVYDLLVTMHDTNGKILRYNFPVVKNR